MRGHDPTLEAARKGGDFSPTHLVLAAGGMSGFAYTGVFSYLQAEGILQRIRHIAGSSIGSLFGLFVALGTPAGEIEAFLKDLARSKERRTIPRRRLMDIVKRYGVDDGRGIIAPLEAEHGDLTFMGLAKRTGRNLVLAATCVETMKCTLFSVDSTPNVRVLDAVRASMAIPMLVEPVVIDGLHYVDGAVTNNYPMDAFPHANPEEILGIYISTDLRASIATNPMENVVSYCTSVFCSYFSRILGRSGTILRTNHRYVIHMDGSNPLPVLALDFTKEGIVMRLAEDDIDRSIAYGYTLAYKVLGGHLPPHAGGSECTQAPVLRLPEPVAD